MIAQTTIRKPLSSKVSSQPLPFLHIEGVSKVYPTAKGPYTVLENVNLSVASGEFICVIGHSGCGKSTLLNMVSGFASPTDGDVLIKGKPITEPGPDRMVVFQNYALLPWLSAFENIYLAVDAAYPNKSEQEKRAIVRDHLDLVGLSDAADKRPGQISGGMKQRVAIARALSIRPRVLILDEPFGALDAITRGNLQEQLMQICEENNVTAVMVTHDVRKALYCKQRVCPQSHCLRNLSISFSHFMKNCCMNYSPR
jgi:bicarbonate transport system ATP-binding protein